MFWQLLTDPLLRGPTLGSLFLGCSSGILGTFMFIRRQSLVAETLSHAAYPGVALALGMLALLATPVQIESWTSGAALLGALGFSWVGLIWLKVLSRQGVREDAALCWVLSASMGVGALIASRLQWLNPTLCRQVQGALYGQSATITDGQAQVFAGFAALTGLAVALFYKELLACHFDPQFASAQGLPKVFIERSMALFTACAVVAGIRGGGIVLTTGLMVGPVVAARALTENFAALLTLSGLFGSLSAFGGIFFSIYLEQRLSLPIPAGPLMVLIAAGTSLLLLLIAPKRGLWQRTWRRASFRLRCSEENILKAALRSDEGLTWRDVQHLLGTGRLLARWFLLRLSCKKYLARSCCGLFTLTSSGRARARYIVRLHRLWELYLVHIVGAKAERVHANAEQIEHVLTPEIERRLTQLLQDPELDPHESAIPPLAPP